MMDFRRTSSPMVQRKHSPNLSVSSTMFISVFSHLCVCIIFKQSDQHRIIFPIYYAIWFQFKIF